MAAQHFASRLQHETDPADVWADIDAGAGAGAGRFVLVDARNPEAYAEAHVPGAVSIPHATIDEQRAADLDPDTLYVTYCWSPSCNASTRAAVALATLGFSVKEMLGGIDAWRAEGYPVVSTQ